MLQILVLYLQLLKVKQYYAFMLFVREAIAKFDVIGERFGFNVEKFMASFDFLNRVYLKYDPAFYTEELQDANTVRIQEFRRFRDYLKTFILNPEDDAKTQAAEKLLKVISLYGGANIVNLGFGPLTTVLTNLIEDCEDKFNAEIEALEAGRRLASFKQAQQKFDEVYMARSEYDSEIGRNAMEEARKKMDYTYRNLIAAVNFAAKYDTEGTLSEFIKLLNVEIRRNYIYTKQNSESGSNPDSVEDGELAVPQKTATFNFAGGNVLKIKGEVGSVLVAPENTEGYQWEPEVPETMPKKNTSYKEVLISGEEATAVFHFADHHEEEVRQLVGSALTAPENTEGYEWEPALPETIPAEDTSYFEVAIAGEEEEEEDERPKYRITFRADGRVVATQEYHEGETIVPPECPEGFEWPDDLPEVMPARNLVIVGVEVD